MKETLIAGISDFSEALHITGKTGRERLMTRCGFNRHGHLSRLCLNGLDIKGEADISEFTKHLTVLDIRNNPGLTVIKISSISELGFLIRFGTEESRSEALKYDQHQSVILCDQGHDADESPFARYFGAESSSKQAQPEVVIPQVSQSDKIRYYDICDGELTSEEMKADLAAFISEVQIEENLLRTAVMRKILIARLQHNLDRTDTGLHKKALTVLKELAQSFEPVKYTDRLVSEIKQGLGPDATENDIKRACIEKADSFWKLKNDNVRLGRYLKAGIDKISVNTNNYGREGRDKLRTARKEKADNYKQLRKSIRDEHLTGSVYGRSNLRLRVRHYTQLVKELKESIEQLQDNIETIRALS